MALGCLPGLACAQLTPAESERLRAQLAVIDTATLAEDWDACQAAADGVWALAFRDWTADARAWHQRDVFCRIGRARAAGSPATQADIEAWFRPIEEHFAMPRQGIVAYAQATVDLGWDRWSRLKAEGHGASATAWMSEQLQPRLGALRADLHNAELLRDLDLWVTRFYGSRDSTAEMLQWHATFSRQLGPAHVLALKLLRALAFNQRQLGRPQEALAYAEEASQLAARHHPDDKALHILIASERLNGLRGIGRHAEARDEAVRVRDHLLARVPTPHSNLMRVQYNLAAIALELGDFDGSVAFAEASLAHARLSGNAGDLQESRVAAVWREEARLQRGDSDAASGLQAALAANTHREPAIGGAAFALARHAARSSDVARLRWARVFLQQWADEHLDPMNVDRALLPMLDAWAAGPADPHNRSVLERALALALSGRSASVALQTRFALASQVAAQRPDSAIWLYKQAANILQTMRAGLPQDDAGLQRAWLADHESDLRAFIGLLIDQGRLAEAQQAIGVLRSEELHEYSRRSRSAPRRTGHAPLSMTTQERQLDTALQLVAAQVQAASRSADARADARAVWRQRTRTVDPEVDASLAAAAAALHTLLSTPALGAAQQAPPSAANIAPALPAGTARLQYFVRADSLDIVVSTRRGVQRARVDVAATELNRMVHSLRSAVSTPGGDARAPALRLHAWLVGPVAAKLAGVHRLQVAADGALRYVPFAALHDGQRYLAERYTVLSELAADTPPAAPNIHARPSQTVRAFGRTLPDASHAALPGVQQELQDLARLRGAQVQTLQDQGFTTEALRQGLLAQPAVVHLASHFVLDAASEENSYLLMGDGQRLSLTRIGALPWQGVQLALLSACDSGVQTSGQGRELAGFAATLQRAGVANVLATLWPIADGATATWMQDFYAPWRQRGAAGATPKAPQAQWVAQAQRQWLRRYAGTALAHPHYWAAFAWMGS